MLRLLSVGLLLAAQGWSMGYEMKGFGLRSHARPAPCVQPGFVSSSALPKFALRARSDLVVAHLHPKASAVRRARLDCRSLGMMADERESLHAPVDSGEVEATWTLQDDLERIRAALDPGSESGRKLQETIEKLETLSNAAVQPKSTKLFKSVKKRTGAFAVMVETCLEEGSEQEVVDLSRQIRQSKSSGIMIDVRNTFSSDGRQSFDQVFMEQVLHHCKLADLFHRYPRSRDRQREIFQGHARLLFAIDLLHIHGRYVSLLLEDTSVC